MDIYKTYVHSIDPFVIQFTENFGIRWYGLAYLAGLVLGCLFIWQMVKRSHRMDMREEWVVDFGDLDGFWNFDWGAFRLLLVLCSRAVFEI